MASSSPINLISSDDEADEQVENVAAAAASTALGKRKAIASEPAPQEEEEEPVVSPAALGKRKALPITAPDPAPQDDDELQFLGRSGQLALADFPHARENCLQKPFKLGDKRSKEFCANCFCLVCDKPASTCGEWAEHCQATHASSEWRAAREAQRQRDLQRPPASAAAASSSSSSSTARPAKKHDEGWGAERLLKACEQVHPVEEAQPRGLLSSITLRPYQKQDLAFMLERERGADMKLPKGALGQRKQAELRSTNLWIALLAPTAPALPRLASHLCHANPEFALTESPPPSALRRWRLVVR